MFVNLSSSYLLLLISFRPLPFCYRSIIRAPSLPHRSQWRMLGEYPQRVTRHYIPYDIHRLWPELLENVLNYLQQPGKL